MAENRVDEISLSWPGAGLGLVWDWRPGAGTGCWGPPRVLGLGAWGWGCGLGLGLGLGLEAGTGAGSLSEVQA